MNEKMVPGRRGHGKLGCSAPVKLLLAIIRPHLCGRVETLRTEARRDIRREARRGALDESTST